MTGVEIIVWIVKLFLKIFFHFIRPVNKRENYTTKI